MASEKSEEKSEEKCKDMENEEIKQLDDNSAERVHTEKEGRLFEKSKDETKDFNLSESESENFEDAMEEVTEKLSLNNEDIKDNSLDEEHDKNIEHGDDEDTYLEPSEPLTEEQKLERKSLAEEHKRKGNEYFKNAEFPEARELYTTAIKTCPPEFQKEKSIFYSNRAACLVRMEMYEDAIRDSTKALELNPDYLKARLRRAQCYEHEDKLEEALEDYQKVLETDKSCVTAREAVMRLPEQIKIKHEKMKEEMLGKLKDLGNLFLKPFGLSTNNFQVQQDPNSGGYSINFQQ